MSKRFRYALMAAVAPLALAMPAAQAATPTQTLVMAMDFADLITFDPGESYEISGQEFGANIYDRLVRYEAEDMDKLVGGVAESWTISSDSKTFTFKLRQGMKYGNGDPVTADDLAWSMQRVVLMDKTPAFLFTQLGWNKENVKSLITAPDAHTLTFKITEDLAPSLVLNLMSTLAASPIDKKVAMSHEKDGDLGNAWLKTNTVASGAFNLVSWKADESVTLEANPNYRLASQHLKRVIIRHVPEPATQRLLLEKGDIDVARGLTPDQLGTLGENKDIRVESFPGGDNYYLGMNTSEEHMKNPKVRQAMKMLVDYDGMVKSFLKDTFFVQQTFLPLGFLGAIPYNPWKFDVAKAKALLAEAGYPNGFELEFTTPNNPPWSAIAQSVQQTMGQGGIKLKLVQVEQKQMLQAFRARKTQLVLNSWAPDYKDPHSNADTFAHNDDDSDTPKIKPLAWRTHWYVPDVTKDTLAASREPDTAKRVKEYEALQKKVTDDGPFILMFQDKYMVVSRANVKNFKLGVFADFNYYRVVSK
jgi:peptide/nickel transport system substrate-binding protein